MIKLEKIKISIAIILGLVLAFGVNLVFAVPPGPNVEAPIHGGIEEQTKEGELGVNQIIQKDWDPLPGGIKTWGYFKDLNRFWFKGLSFGTFLRGWDIRAYNQLWTEGDLTVDGHIYAPNQNWEGTMQASRYVTPNTAVIYCSNGWYLFKLQVADDGTSSKGWCASPFKKVEPSVGGGGGDDVKRAEALAGYGEASDWLYSGGSSWWFMAGAY
jgi:hypothetical protein